MEFLTALPILTALSNGADPFTGEVLQADHVCQNADVVRAFHALFEHVRLLENKIISLKEEKKTDLTPRAREPWMPEEDSRLHSELNSGLLPDKIAGLHQRTVSAITSRLKHLGLIRHSGEAWVIAIRSRNGSAQKSDIQDSADIRVE